MGIRFSKSVKLGKYLRLNFSKSGVSASVGPRGASVNIGNRGTFLNLSPSLVGVNGTGIEKIQIKIIKRTSNIYINDDSKQKSSYGFEFDNTTEDQENAEEIAE